MGGVTHIRRLKKYAMPAAVFLTTDAVDRKGGFWIERLKKAWGEQDLRKQAGSILATVGPRQIRTADFQEILEWLMHMPWRQRHSLLDQILPRRSEESDGVDFMLTWDQAIEMERAGIEIGAHTASHPLLTYEDDATVEYELLSSKRTLEGKLNKPVRAFTYPNGDWNARVRGWVVRTGYAIAFTTRPKWCRSGQDPYAIGRIIIHDGNVTDAKGIFSTSMVDRTLSA
jgi:peptidoglycan/xylan/chitin deacetylase (PgdA/CDA1 family)